MGRRYLKRRTVGTVAAQTSLTASDNLSPLSRRNHLDLTGDLLGGSRRVLEVRSETSAKAAPRRPQRLVSVISALLVVILLWQWGNAGWILVKAQLAQWLIAQAWDSSQAVESSARVQGPSTRNREPSADAQEPLADIREPSADIREPSANIREPVQVQHAVAQMKKPSTKDIKPWPWADTHPVARLRVPKQGVDLFVLEGAHGNSLAFGPGHLHGTALPGDGISVIGGHRDTHFRFLKDVQPGDDLHVQTRDGRQLTYRIEQRQVVDSRHTPLQLPDYPASGLVLVTCYPFDALDPNGPLRLVVWAREITEEGFEPDQQLVPASVFQQRALSVSL